MSQNQVTLTYELAMASSRDAGNRHMKKHGRKAWNVDDWNASVDEFNRLWTIELEMESRRIKANLCPVCSEPQHENAESKFWCLRVEQEVFRRTNA
jgi:hypothetical protein